MSRWPAPVGVDVPYCGLCGRTAEGDEPLHGRVRRWDVRVALVEWQHPSLHPDADSNPQAWSSVDRCVDHRGCEQRAIAAGLGWDVVDPRHRVITAPELVAAAVEDTEDVWGGLR